MPVTKIGVVYYADDPHKRVFRVVYPEFDDSELDAPPTDGNRQVMRKGDGSAHDWGSFGTDGARTRTVEKLLPTDMPARKRGTPGTPASEPVVYLVGMDQLTAAQFDTAVTFIGLNASWSNNITTTAAALPSPLISPTWVACVNASPAGLGAPTRTRNISGNTINVWQV